MRTKIIYEYHKAPNITIKKVVKFPSLQKGQLQIEGPISRYETDDTIATMYHIKVHTKQPSINQN